MKKITKKELIEKYIIDFGYDYYFYDDEDDKQRKLKKINKLKEIIDEFYDKSNLLVLPFTEKETLIFRKTYGILNDGECQNFKTIAEEYNVTRNCISSIMQKINRKLYHEVDLHLTIKVYDNETLDKSINYLDLPSYIYNSLVFNFKRILKIGDLVQTSPNELTRHYGISQKGLSIIESKLDNLGLSLKEDYIADYNELKKMLYEEKLDLDLEKLGLTSGTFNVLSKSGIEKVRDIALKRISEIKSIRNMGEGRYKEIESILKTIGINLVEDEKVIEGKYDKLVSNKEKIIERKKILLEQLQKLQSREAELDKQIEVAKQELENFKTRGYNGK